MAQSTKERQQAFRARQAMLGLAEVRGIYLHPDDHEAVKRFAEFLREQQQRQHAQQDRR